MKAGRSLTELAAELERQQGSKRDYVADTRSLVLEVDGKLAIGGNGTLDVTPICHGQIGARVGIPKKYYDRMATDAPELLARNVNHWFQDKPEKRMVRTLDGRARAFLSERYRPLDNFDLAEAVLPRLTDAGCRVRSSELTDRRFYIQAVTDRIQTDIKPGDPVQAGIVISNSEIGLGSVRVEPMIFRLVCFNGIISADHSLRKYHVGRNSGGADFEGAREFFKDATRELDDRAFWAKVVDVVEATLDEVKFERIVEAMREATEKRIEGDPVKSVEVLANRLTFTDHERGSVLRHLVEGGDLTAYGLANAVTRTARDVPDYDRSIEFERFGGEVIELPKKDWEAIATAA